MRTANAGNFNFQLNSTYVHKYEYQNSEGGEWHQNVGVYSGTGPVFKWQNNFALNWSRGELGAGISGHHKTGYLDQDNDIEPGHGVASYTTFDGYLSWAMKKGFDVTVGVRNMFDRNPPLSYQTTTFQAGYDPRYSAPIGRTLYVRGTYTF